MGDDGKELRVLKDRASFCDRSDGGERGRIRGGGVWLEPPPQP